jgi:hypothetical protein
MSLFYSNKITSTEFAYFFPTKRSPNPTLILAVVVSVASIAPSHKPVGQPYSFRQLLEISVYSIPGLVNP